MEYDYNMARPYGTHGDWERVVDTDYLCDWETGEPLGGDDVFKLEFSGWNRHVEFKPR